MPFEFNLCAASHYETGDSVSISWDETLQYMTLYHLFGVFWTTQFIAGFGMMAGPAGRLFTRSTW